MSHQRFSVSLAATVVCLGVSLALASPAPTFASAPKSVPMVDCEIDGFGLGDSADRMREVFGEPDQDLVVKLPVNDFPHREYAYDGLRIVFSTNGRSALSFYVSSSEYRLRSGIGIGSTWDEIVEVFGPGLLMSSGGGITYSYRVVDGSGYFVPARLRFAMEGEIVAGFSVVTAR